MRLSVNPRTLSLLVLALALAALTGAAIYKWYENKNNYYTAGAPPKELLERVEPKSVPYESIKPPALNSADTFLIGSATDSYDGIIIFGDYTDGASVKLLKDIQPVIAAYGGKMRLVWRQLPATTDSGDASFEAAVVSECSRLLAPSWPAHKALSDAASGRLDNAVINRIADSFDAMGMMSTCRDDANMRKNVKTAIERLRGDGIDKAPFVFVGTRAMTASKYKNADIVKAIKELAK